MRLRELPCGAPLTSRLTSGASWAYICPHGERREEAPEAAHHAERGVDPRSSHGPTEARSRGAGAKGRTGRVGMAAGLGPPRGRPGVQRRLVRVGATVSNG